MLVGMDQQAEALEGVARRGVAVAVMGHVPLLGRLDRAHQRVSLRQPLANLPGGDAKAQRARHLAAQGEDRVTQLGVAAVARVLGGRARNAQRAVRGGGALARDVEPRRRTTRLRALGV
jgi:hypothetical protein